MHVNLLETFGVMPEPKSCRISEYKAPPPGLGKTRWEFPKLGVPYLGVLLIRILLFRVLY